MVLTTPEITYGHAVRGEQLACSGCNRRFFAYALNRSQLVIAEADDPNSPNASFGARQRVAHLEHPAAETISCVVMHPTSDVLCVGTTHHGMYMTTASSPELTSHTRLPFSVTGEGIFSACFAQLSTAATVLIFSSTFQEKKGPMPHRLSLWHLEDHQLLWRGAMEPLTCLCTLSLEGSFAACAGPRLYLFTAQSSPSATTEQPTPGQASAARQRVVVLSRQCTSVPQLEGVDYVQCLAVPSPATDSSFYALTTNGYLVEFDTNTGSVSRWMDCKVCPATSLHAWGAYLILTGSLVRFFRADTWKFGGKLRPITAGSTEAHADSPALEQVLGSTLISTCISTSRDSRRLLFFSRAGSSALFSCAVNASSPGADDEHVLAVCEGQFTPIVSGKAGAASTVSSAEWLALDSVPTSEPSNTPQMAVWTSHAVAALEPLSLTSLSLREKTGCAVYHASTRCVLAFMVAQSQWMAFDCPSRADQGTSASSWLPCGAMSWSCEKDGEPLHVTVSATTGDIAVVSTDNTLTFLTCSRTTGNASASSAVTIQRARSHQARCRLAIVKLVFVGDRLYGVTPQSIVLLSSGGGGRASMDHVAEEFPIPEGIVDACGTMRHVAVVHDKGAYLYRTDRTGRCAAVPVPEAVSTGLLPLRCCQSELSRDCLALGNDAQVLLYRSLQQPSPQLIQVLALQPVPERPLSAAPLSSLRAVGLQARHDSTRHVSVLILNSSGQVTVYNADIGEMSPAPSPVREQGTAAVAAAHEVAPVSAGRPPLVAVSRADPTVASRRARRSTSAAAPTSRELQTRFDALNGFYEHQKQVEAVTPRAGRRSSGRHGEHEARPGSRSASAPLRGARAARGAPMPRTTAEGSTPSPANSPPRPEPFPVSSGYGSGTGAARASSLSAVEVSALSIPSTGSTPIPDRTGRGMTDDSSPNIPLPDYDDAGYGDASSAAWGTKQKQARLQPRAVMSPSRTAPVPHATPDQDVSVASDVSSAATTFSIRARTLRQSLVDLQQLLEEGRLPEEVNSSDDIDELTSLLASVAASLQTLHHAR